MHSQSIRQPYQFELLDRHLRAFLGDLDASVLETLREHLQWVEIIGEMSLYTGEPRSATVVAIRDSVLVRLDRTAFNELLVRSAQVTIALTRQIIKRLQDVLGKMSESELGRFSHRAALAQGCSPQPR